MKYLKIRNWDRFQHYGKHRDPDQPYSPPPWIKLHLALTYDYEFTALEDHQKWHLIGLYLLAARTNNRIPADHEWITDRLCLKTPMQIELYSHWISLEDGSRPLLETPLVSVDKSRQDKTRVLAAPAAAPAKPTRGKNPLKTIPWSPEQQKLHEESQIQMTRELQGHTQDCSQITGGFDCDCEFRGRMWGKRKKPRKLTEFQRCLEHWKVLHLTVLGVPYVNGNHARDNRALTPILKTYGVAGTVELIGYFWDWQLDDKNGTDDTFIGKCVPSIPNFCSKIPLMLKHCTLEEYQP